MAVDGLGFRYLAASNGGALRVSPPRGARDDDGDGLPLLMALALCRDPGAAEIGPLLRADFETTPDGQSEIVMLEYDRPAGPAEVSLETTLDAGIFRYRLENSSAPDGFVPVRRFPTA